jgi:hypothetical protein
MYDEYQKTKPINVRFISFGLQSNKIVLARHHKLLAGVQRNEMRSLIFLQ